MSEITEDEKKPENDADIVIHDDVWIGSGSIILKGVVIGTGSVVGAGTIVTKSVPPYTIITNPGMRDRFTEDEIKAHEQIMKAGK